MPQRFSISGALGVSLAAVAVLVTAFLAAAPAMFSTIAALLPVSESRHGALNELLARHFKSVADSQARFAGRSAFFRPPQPPPPEPQKIQIIEPKIIDTRPAETPPYRGPNLVGLYDDEAWFKSNSSEVLVTRIAVGSNASGIGVVETNPPWSARVTFAGHEYELPLMRESDPDLFTARPTRAVRGLRMLPSAGIDQTGGIR